MNNCVNDFHTYYYNSDIFTSWFGHRIFKCPLDLMLYQEILFQIKPDVIIECGTCHGASALFLANMCDLLNKGKIITIDVLEQPNRPIHPKITYLLGDSTSPEIFNKVKELIYPNSVVLVILDSDHTEPHVYKEMELYNQLVSKGSYLIVEDTNICGNPVPAHFHLAPGPMAAVQKFIENNKNFSIDTTKHKFHLTFNPNGYLLKTR